MGYQIVAFLLGFVTAIKDEQIKFFILVILQG